GSIDPRVSRRFRRTLYSGRPLGRKASPRVLLRWSPGFSRLKPGLQRPVCLARGHFQRRVKKHTPLAVGPGADENMSQADFWYIRFPDGRILRAASTIILRQELSAGHIPLGSTVRRSPEDEWVSLEWTQEFADLVERLAASSRAKQAETRRRTPVPAAAPRETPNAAPVPVDAATVGSRLDGTRLHL